MDTHITNFISKRIWSTEKEYDFRLFHRLYAKENAKYCLFTFTETKRFEKEYRDLNTKENRVYVCEGDLVQFLFHLNYDFDKKELLETDSGVLKIKLTKTDFEFEKRHYIFTKQPKIRIAEGTIYHLTEEEFQKIPFSSNPISLEKDTFRLDKLSESIPMDDALEHYFSTHFHPLTTSEQLTDRMKYRLIQRQKAKRYIPKTVNSKAFELAKQHDLNLIEFNFLNHLYETEMAFCNGDGQFLYDIHNGKSYSNWHDRKWVKRKMARLMDLGLVNFEIRHDGRDSRHTSWYFYDAEKNLDELDYI